VKGATRKRYGEGEGKRILNVRKWGGQGVGRLKWRRPAKKGRKSKKGLRVEEALSECQRDETPRKIGYSEKGGGCRKASLRQILMEAVGDKAYGSHREDRS